MRYVKLRPVQFTHDTLTEDSRVQLRELVAVVAAAMGGEIADDDAEVVEEVNERFKVTWTLANTPYDILTALEEKAMPVADVLSKQFQQDGKTLSDLMAPSMSSILTSPTDDMASCVETLQTETCTAQTQAASSRLEVAHALNSIHHIARQVLERCIRLLEQTIHGSMARNAKAHAEYLCTVAEGMAKKLAVQHQQVVRQVYSADMTELLKLKTRQIAQEQVASKRQTKEAEEELKRYESMRGVEGLVEEYAQILAESGRIRREIEKLET